MEQVLFRLHVRTIRTVSGFLNFRMRAITEKAILFCALTSLVILYILHNAYVSPVGPNCIVSQLGNKGITADADILAIHILGTDESWDFIYSNKYASALTSKLDDPWKESMKEYFNTLTTVLNDSYFAKIYPNILEPFKNTRDAIITSKETTVEGKWDIGEQCNDVGGTRYERYSSCSKTLYLFSLEKGYLLLGQGKLDKHNITRLDMTVSDNDSCFGPSMYAWLLRQFVGYDTVVKNWVIKYFAGNGYLYNVYSKELFDLNLVADFVTKTGTAGHIGAVASSKGAGEGANGGSRTGVTVLTNIRGGLGRGGGDGESGKTDVIDVCGSAGPDQMVAKEHTDEVVAAALFAWTSLFWGSVSSAQHYVAFKVGVVLTTMFLFFTMTTLVSFTLRVTQERMLKFTFLLQRHISHRIPYATLIFTHVVESLVFVPLMAGVLFFLFEFFLDQLLAFLVLSVVWLAEVYSVICLRTAVSIRFFPRMFFLYFSLFHIYFFCFPFGFSYLALLSTVLHLLHAMIFFWHTYEIPAFQQGLITALAPREVVGGDAASVSAFQVQMSGGGGYGETLAMPPAAVAGPGSQASGMPAASVGGASGGASGAASRRTGAGHGVGYTGGHTGGQLSAGHGSDQRASASRSRSASDEKGGMSSVERSRSGSGSSSGGSAVSTSSSSGNNAGTATTSASINSSIAAGGGGGTSSGRRSDSVGGFGPGRLAPIPPFGGHGTVHSSSREAGQQSPTRSTPGLGPAIPASVGAAVVSTAGGWSLPSPPRSTRSRASHHHHHRPEQQQQQQQQQQAAQLGRPMTMQESCSRHVELSRRIQQQQMANMMGLDPEPLSPPSLQHPLAFSLGGSGSGGGGIAVASTGSVSGSSSSGNSSGNGTPTVGVVGVGMGAGVGIGAIPAVDDSWFMGDTF